MINKSQVSVIFCLATALSVFACDDGNDSPSSNYLSSREKAAVAAKEKNCAISLLTGSCSADGGSIASVKCDGVELNVGGPCPEGMQCITINEIIGPVPYCVPKANPPECIVASCDSAKDNLIKECKSGKWESRNCGEGEVCRVLGKDELGKDLGATCVSKPDGSKAPAEDEWEPCKQSGHGQTVKTACSADEKQALYTCSDSYVIVEGCGIYKCEAIDLRQTVNQWAADATNPVIKGMISAIAATLPEGEMHSCNLATIVQGYKTMIDSMSGM